MTTNFEGRHNREMAAYGLRYFPNSHDVLVSQNEALALVTDDVVTGKMRRCLNDFGNTKKLEKFECGLAVCAICQDRFRRRVIKRSCHLAYRFRLRGMHYTLADTTLKVKVGLLQDFDDVMAIFKVKAAIQDAIKTFKSTCSVLAVLEFGLDEDLENARSGITPAERKLGHHWSPHFHIVIIYKYPMKLRPYLLSPLTPLQEKGHTPLVAAKSYGLSAHIEYATKFDPDRRALATDKKGNRTRKTRSVSDQRMRELYAFLGDKPLTHIWMVDFGLQQI